LNIAKRQAKYKYNSFGPKREEVTGGWGKVYKYNEELHNLHSSSSILVTGMSKSGRMISARNIVRMEKRGMPTG
jgi:hypothetical protein